MKKSTKAALFSALVFPGIGHFYLKRYIPGSIIFGIAAACTYYIVTKSIDRAFEIVDKIQSGAVPPDLVTINEMVSKQSAGADAGLMNLATLLLGIIWVIGIVAAYLAGQGEKDI
jgi:TM2 domain-containing membrane protein YozV